MGPGSNHDDGDIGVPAMNFFQHLETLHARQLDVQQYSWGRCRSKTSSASMPSAETRTPYPRMQAIFQSFLNIGVIIDNEDGLTGEFHEFFPNQPRRYCKWMIELVDKAE